VLSVDEARAIAAEVRSQFIDEASFEQSWSRFFDHVGDPTPTKLRNWLAKDLAKDAVRHAGIVREPVLPTEQQLPPHLQRAYDVDLDDYVSARARDVCHHCHGTRAEPAGEQCHHRPWHTPNADELVTPVRGWTQPFGGAA